MDYETALWPRSQHFARTFHVRSGAKSGTAFCVDVDNKQYLVSALHVVEEAASTALLEVWSSNAWKAFNVNLVGYDSIADVAVFALMQRMTTAANIPLGSDGCITGQAIFFLGYPLGIRGYGVQPQGFPIATVKRGVVSLNIPTDLRDFYISASVNPGFSGGPVFFLTN